MDKAWKWEKRGLLLEPNNPGFTHASHPTIAHVADDTFVIAYSCRDSQRRSHIFLVRAEVIGGEITLKGQPTVALVPGLPGCFDCDGLLSCCFVVQGASCYLYYSGWQNLPNGLWICDTGRAIVDPINLTARREYSGPVLARDKDNPLFAAATSVLIDPQGRWHTWYNSGLKWEREGVEWKAWYGIHHAESNNGVDWVCDPALCIPMVDDLEHSFGRPSVVSWDGRLYMWFSHRGDAGRAEYRMGFASSEDATHWTRKDDLAGIDVSASGWDSEMVCYPYVFKHKGTCYMLYSGNRYGISGSGYAVLQN
jgi:hypothetical protein